MRGDNWSITNLIKNTKTYGPDIIKNKYQPYIFSLFLLVGSITFYFKEKGNWIFLMLWFFLLYLIYFTSWLQTLGGKPRLFMMFSPITSIFVSYGIFSFNSGLKKSLKINNSKDDILLLIIAFFLVILIFFSKNKIESNFDIGASLEAKVIGKTKEDIPQACTLVRTIPLISTSTSDIKAISISQFLEIDNPNLESNCFVFLEDLPCFNDVMYENNVKTKVLCQNLKNEYNLSELKQYKMNNLKYTLYKIESKIEDEN